MTDVQPMACQSGELRGGSRLRMAKRKPDVIARPGRLASSPSLQSRAANRLQLGARYRSSPATPAVVRCIVQALVNPAQRELLTEWRMVPWLWPQ